MPIGGRVNRRDNLRSKVSSKQIKPDVEKRSSRRGTMAPKSQKFSGAVDFSNNLFTNYKLSNSTVSSDKSVSALGDIYVQLKDIMNNKSKKEKSTKNIKQTSVVTTKRNNNNKVTGILHNKKVELLENINNKTISSSPKEVKSNSNVNRMSVNITRITKSNRLNKPVTRQVKEKHNIKTNKLSIVTTDMPFVVELDSFDNSTIVYNEAGKVPGLAFLKDLKNTKSRIQDNSDDNPLKIPGLKSIDQIRRRKTGTDLVSTFDQSNKINNSKNIITRSKRPVLDDESAIVRKKIIRKNRISKLKFNNLPPDNSKKGEVKKIKLSAKNIESSATGIKQRISDLGCSEETICEDVVNPQISPMKRKSVGVLHKKSEGQSKIRLKDRTKKKEKRLTKITKNRISDRKPIKTTLKSDSDLDSKKFRESRKLRNKNLSSENSSPTKSDIRISRTLDTTPERKYRKSVLDSYSDSEIKGYGHRMSDESNVSVARRRKSILESSVGIDSRDVATGSIGDDCKIVESLFVCEDSDGKHTPKVQTRLPRISIREPSSLRSLNNLKTTISNLNTSEAQIIDQKRSSVKRPISSLTYEYNGKLDLTREPKEKLARLEDNAMSSRQSVIFNNLVEVKEIKGNSFNSESGVTDTSERDAIDLSELKQRVKESIEKTKRELIQKRLDAACSSALERPFGNKGLRGTYSKTDAETVTCRRLGLRNFESRRTNIISLVPEVQNEGNSTATAADCGDLRSKFSSMKHIKKSVVVLKEDLEVNDADKEEVSMSSEVSDEQVGSGDGVEKRNRCTML